MCDHVSFYFMTPIRVQNLRWEIHSVLTNGFSTVQPAKWDYNVKGKRNSSSKAWKGGGIGGTNPGHASSHQGSFNFWPWSTWITMSDHNCFETATPSRHLGWEKDPGLNEWPLSLTKQCHCPRHLILGTYSGVMCPGYIDLILVTSGLSRQCCPAHFLCGGDFTADLPHKHHHPPFCSLGNPLIPTVISFVFVVAHLSLARTPSHQPPFVLCGFGKWGEEHKAFWSKECATCYEDACQERGWL